MLFLFSSASQAVDLTYNPSEDAYVRGGSSSSNNYGTDVNLVVKQGTVSNFFRKSLLKFDLSSEGLSTATITQATLRLYANQASTVTITASEADDNWTDPK